MLLGIRMFVSEVAIPIKWPLAAVPQPELHRAVALTAYISSISESSFAVHIMSSVADTNAATVALYRAM